MADFGLTEDMYATNYFRCSEKSVRSEEKVPIKWMAPESIERSLYNEKTDVVSISTIGPSVKINANSLVCFGSEENHWTSS